MRLLTIPKLVAAFAACLSLHTAAFDARADDKEIVHVVAKGQTLGRIAKRYNVTIDALREANDLPRGAKIRPGLRLTIPTEDAKTKRSSDKSAARGESRSGARAKTKAGSQAARDAADGKRQRSRGDADSGKDRWAKRPPRPGFVRLVRGTERLEVQLLGRKSKLQPTALEGLNRILRHTATNARTPIDPRLAALLGMVSDHFGGRTIHVVSGYRPYSPKQYTKHSNHNIGRAIDFRIEGVPNTVVRDYCRTFRNAGVGYYPNSTFVHLDVRNVKAYWIDYSRPGEPPRYDPAHRPADADESAADVHDATETGSNETQVGTMEAIDSIDGIRDSADFDRGNSLGRGVHAPIPSSRSSPAPGVP